MKEDIYQAVMDAKKAWNALAKSNGKSDSDEVVKLMPTHNEALQATLLLWKYTKYLDKPFTCKLELMLGSFGQEIHADAIQNTKDIKLTDYFHLKE